MNKLIELRNKIESFYLKHERIAGFVIRLVIAFICFIVMRDIISFNSILSSIWIIILLSIICGFVPFKFMPLVILAYTVAQVFTLSIALGITILIVLAVMYLLFYRFAPQYGAILILLPMMFWMKLPLLLVALLATIGPSISVITVIFGTLFFYLMHFLNANAATFASTTGTLEFTKVELLVEGVFENKEFLYVLAVLFVVFMIIHFLKRINFNHSVDIAIAVGTGAFIILTLGCELLIGSLTTGKLLSYVLGGLASGALAIFITNFWFPLDYARTETVEFEDDEYTYYVKAVPKATFEKEKVQIKRINKRKVL